MSESSSSFIVFSDDWGRHPSSCQHLFRQLVQEHHVWWINTIGMRRPSLDLATIRRAFEKVTHWARKSSSATSESQPENLHVSNPRMWPWFGSTFSRRINRHLLTRHLNDLTKAIVGQPTVVTTIPIVADLISEFPTWRWVYYCVDDFSVWPGVDQKAMQSMEEKLIQECHQLIAVSDTLKSKLEQTGRSVHLLTHGVDLDHWRRPEEESLSVLDGLERPLIVFWGVVDRRMDVSWVDQLAESLEQGTVLLVGPQADPDPKLFTPARVTHLPAMAFDDLPLLAKEASVLIMPYDDLPVTRAMQPLKLKEYLATGRPTVVRDLPANRAWADCMDVTGNLSDFIDRVKERISTGMTEEHQQARIRLSDESWSAKSKLFYEWITNSQN